MQCENRKKNRNSQITIETKYTLSVRYDTLSLFLLYYYYAKRLNLEPYLEGRGRLGKYTSPNDSFVYFLVPVYHGFFPIIQFQILAKKITITVMRIIKIITKVNSLKVIKKSIPSTYSSYSIGSLNNILEIIHYVYYEYILNIASLLYIVKLL